jgi:hypothetical protein
MLKKALMGVIAGASLFALVGAAQADVEVNIYGASAQYEFWNAAAQPFLTAPTAAGGLACTSAVKATNSAKNGITVGTGCPTYNQVTIRYSSKASYDGIRAAAGVDPDNGDACTSGAERMMADETQTDFGTGLVNGTKCVDVTVGASDVALSTFKQTSQGCLNGNVTPCSRITRNMNAGTILPGGTPASLDEYKAGLIVPFGFFANTSVPVSNLSRMQAVALFGGKIGNWNEFNPAYASQNTVICLRHAGSGTHATLDAAVMRGDSGLITNQPAINNTNPIRWFYEGSSGMRDAVDTLAGAVGYMDADITILSGTKALTLEGQAASREAIRYGSYPFWSAQWMFEDTAAADYTASHPVVAALVDFASDGTNLTTYLGTKANFWATEGELLVTKPNDFALPIHN